MKPRQETFLHSIGFGVVWRLLSKLVGFFKHIIVASAIGLSAQLDVFYMALSILGILVFSWSGVLEIIAIPKLIELYKNKQYATFKQLTGGLFWLVFLGSALLSIIVFFMSNYLARIAIGFEPYRTQILGNAFYWFIPAVLLVVPASLMGGIMRATRQFSHCNKSEFMGSVIILICVLLYTDNENVLFWSFALSIVVGFVYLLFFSYQYIDFSANPLSDTVKHCLKFSLGLLVLQGANYVYAVSDRIFISFLTTGAISALSYGLVLISLAPAVLGIHQSFITVLAEKPSKTQRSNILNDAISLGVYIAVPVSAIMLNFRVEIVSFLLERGAFSHQNTLMVSSAMLGYMWLLLPIFFLPLLEQVFQVERRIRIMVSRVILGMISNVILNSLFLFYFKLGVFGIALATSISFWLMIFVSLQAIQKMGYTITWFAHLKWGLWLGIIFSSIPITKHLNPFNTPALLELIVIGIISLSLMLIAGWFYPAVNERRLVKDNLAKIGKKIIG